MDKKNSKNNEEIPLTDIDYEGVIYEPSNKSKATSNTKNKSKTLTENNKPKKKIKVAQNFKLSNILLGTAFISILIISVVFSLTYKGISYYLPNTSNLDTSFSDIQSIEEIDTTKDSKSITALVKDIAFESGIFYLLDINKAKNYSFKAISSSTFKDSYDSIITLTEIKKGDIVNVNYDSTNKIIVMQKAKGAFYLENVEAKYLNTDNKTFKINQNTYTLNESLIINKDNEDFSLKSISNLDTLNISGYNSQIFYINVKKVHGILKFINIPNLTDATLEIDGDIFKLLSETKEIPLKEGTHKLVIRSKFISPFVKEFSINESKETVIDLASIQAKRGTLFINSNVSEYKLYINNVLSSSNNSIQLEYGTYLIKLEKENYKTFETQVFINRDIINLSITLEEIKSLVNINIASSPTEAQVFIDNLLIGYTPLNYKVEYGVHNIILKKEGYKDSHLSGIEINDTNSIFNIALESETKESYKSLETEQN